MELKDLVGEHYLSGLDTGTMPAKEIYCEDEDYFLFILDGVTYKAIEDPSDGYRSYLKELETSDEKVNYTFPPQRVIGIMSEDDTYSRNDVIKFFNPDNDKIVLEIGTNNWDDYYPYSVMYWHPENLSINQSQLTEKQIKQ